ncbi:MAG: Lacal_2735 family protein [Bacteroidota bacterium]|nr:Lacal_2735 family protein [Bacteroidota bacterium]MDX5447562.1 Lacal_2735 family protein [Bacteroidota bacterium]
MFGFFKKKSEKEKLIHQYNQLLEESHRLSTSNRAKSDQKRSEAEELWKRIEKMEG